MHLLRLGLDLKKKTVIRMKEIENNTQEKMDYVNRKIPEEPGMPKRGSLVKDENFVHERRKTNLILGISPSFNMKFF